MELLMPENTIRGCHGHINGDSFQARIVDRARFVAAGAAGNGMSQRAEWSWLQWSVSGGIASAEDGNGWCGERIGDMCRSSIVGNQHRQSIYDRSQRHQRGFPDQIEMWFANLSSQ